MINETIYCPALALSGGEAYIRMLGAYYMETQFFKDKPKFMADGFVYVKPKVTEK